MSHGLFNVIALNIMSGLPQMLSVCLTCRHHNNLGDKSGYTIYMSQFGAVEVAYLRVSQDCQGSCQCCGRNNQRVGSYSFTRVLSISSEVIRG